MDSAATAAAAAATAGCSAGRAVEGRNPALERVGEAAGNLGREKAVARALGTARAAGSGVEA